MPDDDAWDEDTPIGDVPHADGVPRDTPAEKSSKLKKLGALTKPTPPSGIGAYSSHAARPRPEPQRASANEALRQIGDVKLLFENHAKSDEDALRNIRSTLDDHGKALLSIGLKVDSSTSVAGVLTAELQHRRQMDLREQELEAKANDGASVERREKMANSTKIWLGILPLVATLATLLIKHYVG